MPIEGYEVAVLDEPIKVYNFEVEGFHTYYVSGQKVLVHNSYKRGSNHGNSLRTKKNADLYVLRDKESHIVKKVGETTMGKRRYTKKYYRKNNVYMQKIDSGSKRDMHFKQHRILRKYKSKAGRLPALNKSLW